MAHKKVLVQEVNENALEEALDILLEYEKELPARDFKDHASCPCCGMIKEEAEAAAQ